MRKLRVAEKAETELVEIISGLSEFSEKAARRLHDAVTEKYEDLLQLPLMGSACDRIKLGWRFFSVDGTYLVFYRVTDDSIDILHVVHGMRDLLSLFSADS